MASAEVAPGLPDRARFVLQHCGQPLRFRGSVAQQRGTVGDWSTTTSVRYRCDTCGAMLEAHLTEPEAG